MDLYTVYAIQCIGPSVVAQYGAQYDHFWKKVIWLFGYLVISMIFKKKYFPSLVMVVIWLFCYFNEKINKKSQSGYGGYLVIWLFQNKMQVWLWWLFGYLVISMKNPRLVFYENPELSRPTPILYHSAPQILTWRGRWLP